jgi:DegV family protein with EDD domain
MWYNISAFQNGREPEGETMIKITTDSTCDLPAWVLEKYHISVIPLGVVKGGALYRDGVDISTADIAAHVDAGGDITTTNAVNIADYETLFRRETARNDAVIHINIGPGFSCCHQNALLAAEEVPGVHVVSSENLSVGHGLMVLAAAEAAERGCSVEEILKLLAHMTGRVEMSFVLDRLDYMKKGGRCSAVTALGANLLKLHPCVEVIDGKMTVTKKFRGSIEKVAADYLRERLAARTDIDTRRAILVDTCQDDRLAAIGREVLNEDGRFGEVIEAKAGCTIFSHSGPGTLGIVFLRK